MIRVGTIVTRNDPRDNTKTCEDGTCVGKIEGIRQVHGYPDNPTITVVWWESCNYHNYLAGRPYTYLIPELWEIGQIPQHG